MGFLVAVPLAGEAAVISDIHLRAMGANLLTHAQFPGQADRDFFHGWLTRNTLQHVRDADKGVLVARDAASGRVASFVKWLVHEPGGGESAASNLESFSDVCGTEVRRSYGELTEKVREGAMGTSAYYHVTFLCTDTHWGGRGAATALLRRVQELAAEDGLGIILEATMEGVPLYCKMGFRVHQDLRMMLPSHGSTQLLEPYEERCMVWTPPVLSTR
ncbi:hypothetical protein HIM_06015 [Hirsutella minnesotensis 3608]|uniref:N-acetyltransferase domain-containing protein n=1 Tax=Hirsutella minnesotensis 3608 TaxID=1043627 RepID=A0A0F7ZP06_9HYPO|nr:hypothetical protein HIM_06015 [Hirsutella minnesotensis 3608]